jgi:hypothetical protein
MAIIVEDGTGLPNAESYISVDDADAYHDNRGNTTWGTMQTVEKEQALRRGTDYMEQMYRSLWKGTRVTASQRLSWPRAFVLREDFYATSTLIPDTLNGEFYYPSDIVPEEVKQACAELAWRAAQGELSPDLTQGIIREKVDVLEVQYDQYSPQSPRYKAIDMLLAPFLNGSRNSLKVRRV